VDRYHHAKFHHDPTTLRPHICENKYQVTCPFSLGEFFRQPSAKTPALIFTINTSNGVVSRKDVAFEGRENKYFTFRSHLRKKEILTSQFMQREIIIWNCRRSYMRLKKMTAC